VEDFVAWKWGSGWDWGELYSVVDMRVVGRAEVMQWYDRENFSKDFIWNAI
jgi:hypothetical protein